MATTIKTLGQANPSTTSNVDLYTVPAGRSTVISTISVCNVSGSTANAYVYIRPSGAAASATTALSYNTPVASGTTLGITFGITMAATDIITVASGTAGALTFHAYGSENS